MLGDMRARRIRPLNRAIGHTPSFTRAVENSRLGGARGYDLLGLAVARAVLDDPARFLGTDGAVQLAGLLGGTAVRAIVRLFVRRIPSVLRRVPFRRRYRSFACGVERAIREHHARNSNMVA